MSTAKGNHPASAAHHEAAGHHQAAAHHALQAAHHHEMGEHDEAKKHATAEHEHSGCGVQEPGRGDLRRAFLLRSGGPVPPSQRVITTTLNQAFSGLSLQWLDVEKLYVHDWKVVKFFAIIMV